MKWFCLPLSIRLHDGLQPAADWEQSGIAPGSHVVRMIEDGFEAARVIGKSILLLDRYFLSVPALARLKELNATLTGHLQMITKAKANCTAYELPPPKRAGRGRPAKKGDSLKLMELFSSRQECFEERVLSLYGKQETVRFYCTDLLWGQKLYQQLRFVLVEYNGFKSILVSSDCTISPETIIRLYSYRFRIECCFREFKQQLGGFDYHFWTKAMPRLNRFRKKDDPHPLAQVTHKAQRIQILKTVQALECHVFLASIAMGLLQILSLRFSSSLPEGNLRYLRTTSCPILSEASMMDFFRRRFFRLIAASPDLTITRIIHDRQSPLDDSLFFLAS
jgi:hypothetical protein